MAAWRDRPYTQHRTDRPDQELTEPVVKNRPDAATARRPALAASSTVMSGYRCAALERAAAWLGRGEGSGCRLDETQPKREHPSRWSARTPEAGAAVVDGQVVDHHQTARPPILPRAGPRPLARILKPLTSRAVYSGCLGPMGWTTDQVPCPADVVQLFCSRTRSTSAVYPNCMTGIGTRRPTTDTNRIIAVHGRNGFARDWPAAAARLGIEVRHIDAYSSTLWTDLEACDALLWSLNQDDPRDLAYARSILQAAARRGIRVFPNHATAWHFDDKVAQKYLLEAIGAPLVDTWVFYDRKDALAFLDETEYPLVFKLSRGAGSLNVRLVRDAREGRAWVARMFGPGVRAFPVGGGVKQAAKRARQARPEAGNLVARARRALPNVIRRILRPQVERGYILFQRFVPDNAEDVRVTIIGDRAFVFKRSVRPNDFRASGSGLLTYPGPADLPRDMITTAFEVCKGIGAQSLAMDFVRDPADGRALLLEISFSFLASAVAQCPGYFDTQLEWTQGSFDPTELILKDLLSERG